MKFVEYSLSCLVAYTKTEIYRKSRIIPITRHRAESQETNPRADKEDIVLIVAYNDEEEVIGFIGALPDRILVKKKMKIAWNSCWWVDPYRGKEAAMPLFYRFVDRWKKKVIFADLTPHTYRVLNTMGMFKTTIFHGCRGYLRLPLSKVLPEKNISFRSVQWLLVMTDSVFNLIWNIRLLIWKVRHREKQGIEWQQVNIVDEQIRKLMKQTSEKELVRRGQEEFEWIRKYPWVIEGEIDELAKRYPFTSHARRFNQNWVKITERGEIRAFIMLTLRDGHLKLPYLYFTDNALPAILKFLIDYMINEKAVYLTVFNDTLAGFIFKSKSPFLYKRSVPKLTALSMELYELTGDKYILQDGDGDCVFT